jgi:hypothetical protein
VGGNGIAQQEGQMSADEREGNKANVHREVPEQVEGQADPDNLKPIESWHK